MKDLQAHPEKLRIDAAECMLISNLATDRKKQELFARLAQHLTLLASEVERAMAGKLSATPPKEVSGKGLQGVLERDQGLRMPPLLEKVCDIASVRGALDDHP